MGSFFNVNEMVGILQRKILLPPLPITGENWSLLPPSWAKLLRYFSCQIVEHIKKLRERTMLPLRVMCRIPLSLDLQRVLCSNRSSWYSMTSLLDLTWLVQIGILVSCWAWRVWWCCNRFPPLFPLSQLMVTPVGMLVMLFWFWWILYGSSSSAHPKFLTLFVRHAHWMHCCEVIISPTIAFWRIVAPKWRSLMYFSCHPL